MQAVQTYQITNAPEQTSWKDYFDLLKPRGVRALYRASALSFTAFGAIRMVEPVIREFGITNSYASAGVRVAGAIAGVGLGTMLCGTALMARIKQDSNKMIRGYSGATSSNA